MGVFTTRTMFFLCLAAGYGATPVLAQDSLPFDLEGRIALGVSLPDDPAFDTFNYATIDLEGQIPFGQNAAFGLGFDAFVLSNLEDEPTEYVDLYLYYDFGPGQVQVGHAQSAIDLFLPDHPLTFGGRSEISLLLEVFQHNTFVRRLSYGEEPALGLSYFGDYGMFEAAASVHFNQEGDGTAYAFAGLYNVSASVELFGGTEFVESTSTDPDPRFWLGGRYEANGLFVEGIYSTGVNFISGQDTFEVNLRYEIPTLQNLTLGASLFSNRGFGGDADHYAIGAEYVADNGLGIGASASGLDGDITDFRVEASYNF
ncbi:hypothetical protein A8B78_09090 [Jannaschia sp. EhC01]|nr:hypothetical protein A8B78_09090 [Jannaschia sp. EhC01]